MRRLLCLFLTLMMLVSSLSVSFVAKAGEFVCTIKSFVYDGYEIPAYDGDAYEIINNNAPKFSRAELNQSIYESYGKLDELGRVTACTANIDQSLMPAPDEKRGSISSVYPTGWKQNLYDFVNGKYLYNRSHLIGWQLTAENANKNNLMTGTRSFNVAGMLPFENEVANYVKQNEENNVLYRVTPVFQGDNLLASGVIMEAESVDDYGESVEFCVFVYNVENGVSLDYETGENCERSQVNSKVITSSMVTVGNCSYNGKVQRPKVTVNVDDKILTEGEDYKLYYENNINAGIAKVTVTGIEDYHGVVTKSFNISKAKYTPTTSSKTYTYDGNYHSILISNVKSGSTIKYKTTKDGTYSTKKPTRKAVGKTTVYYSITNPNYYAVSGSKTVTVLPKNTSSFSLGKIKGGINVSWNKQATQTTGYQIRYSLNSNMSSSKTVTVSSNKTTSKKITSLKKKKYYVQIRTYKTVSGTKYYSSWSNKRYITVTY